MYEKLDVGDCDELLTVPGVIMYGKFDCVELLTVPGEIM